MMLGAVVPRMMTLTEVYLWVLVTSCGIIVVTIDLFYIRLQRVLPAADFAVLRGSSATLINNCTLVVLEAALTLLLLSPGSTFPRRFVYVSLAWITWSLCGLVLIVELAVVAHGYQFRFAVHRTVVGATIFYAFASAAWGPDA